jgi:flagellar biosynthesis chaperone FliJ
MNAQIQNLTNLLTVLQNDTANKQAVLYEVQKQVENAQNQLGLHGTMLNAFNIMLQNPEYFTNMMSVALQYIQSQTPIYEGEYTT